MHTLGLHEDLEKLLTIFLKIKTSILFYDIHESRGYDFNTDHFSSSSQSPIKTCWFKENEEWLKKGNIYSVFVTIRIYWNIKSK